MKIRHVFILAFFLVSLINAQSIFAQTAHVDLIQIQGGTINPASGNFIIEAIDRAETNNARCLIIELDTPGGLLSATQKIVKRMLSSNVPLVVYVSPSGAGAVSAGVSITIAAHFAVMAPGTSIGAAHPVTGGGKTDSSDVGIQKATNWWASFNQSIAEKRGRNPEWVVQAVKLSISATETEALENNVIDYICPNVDSLLVLLNGKTAEVDTGIVTLKTKKAKIIVHEMNIRAKILDMISNPSIAYILMMLGILGIYFELSNPGAIFPGVLGGIFLILAFFALQQLPVNAAGILLILFATILFILEVKITSYGVLTIGGIVAMLLGSLMLFKSTPTMNIHLPLTIILAVTITVAAFFIFAISMALKTKLTKVTTGKEGIIGETGIAISKIAPEGDVKVHGEYWKAFSDELIKKGEKIIVENVDGLKLKVTKIS